MNLYYDCLETEFGRIYIVVNKAGVCKIVVTDEDWQTYTETHACHPDSDMCGYAMKELAEYITGERLHFTVPVSIGGTPFNRNVWQTLCRIPYGQTRSYADIAAAVGNPRAYRAVGHANYLNPLPILIPCHRVVGKNGRLTGYKGDNTAIKEYLLNLEQHHKPQGMQEALTRGTSLIDGEGI